MLDDAEWTCVQCGRYYFLRNAELYDPSWGVRSRLMEQPALSSDGLEVAALAELAGSGHPNIP